MLLYGQMVGRGGMFCGMELTKMKWDCNKLLTIPLFWLLSQVLIESGRRREI